MIKILVAAVVILSTLSGCGGRQAICSELSNLLRANDFTLYTPFRTEDRPGTIFVLTPDHRGHMTEFTLSTPSQTFKPSVDPNALLQEQGIKFAEQLSKTRTFGGSVAVDLISMLIDGSVAAKYFSEVTITFGSPQISQLLSHERLTAHRSEISPTTLETLRFYKQQGRLNSAYFVFETLEVASLTARAKVKREFVGELDAQQIEQALKVGVKLDHVAEETFSISSDRPILIGYKAIRIPDTMIGTAVSPALIKYEYRGPEQILKLKR